MTQTEQHAAFDALIYLCACAVNGDTPDPGRVAAMDLPGLFEVAQAHLLSAIAGYALEEAGVYDPAFVEAKDRAIRKNVLLLNECEAVMNSLAAAGIWHMPLKGAVLHSLYPDIGLRQMADVDILYDAARTADVREIMERLGFQTEELGKFHHDVYYKEPVCNFEMHRELCPDSDEKIYAYYKDVYKRLLGEGYEKHFSPEDFYLYLTAHEYKHYSNHGTGLRSLLDAYVVLRKEALDFDYVTAEADKLGIQDFEAENRSLALRLFSGETLTEADRKMLDFIMASGAHGSWDGGVQKRLSDFGYGKLRYALERFLEPVNKNSWNYRNLSYEFPFFYRHKILLPVLLVYRVVYRLIQGRLSAELKALKKAKSRDGHA